MSKDKSLSSDSPPPSTTGSREKALPQTTHPVRLMLNAHDVDDESEVLRGAFNDGQMDLGVDYYEYMPVSEHEHLISQARAEARASAFEEAWKEAAERVNTAGAIIQGTRNKVAQNLGRALYALADEFEEIAYARAKAARSSAGAEEEKR